MILLRKAGAVFNRVLDLLAGVAGILVIGMMIVMSYEVILRYLMHRALAWPVEITEYMVYLAEFQPQKRGSSYHSHQNIMEVKL